MKFKFLFLSLFLSALCTLGYAQKETIAIWEPEDEENLLSKGKKRELTANLEQHINETLHAFKAVRRTGTLKQKELNYTQSGNTLREKESGRELTCDYYLSPVVMSYDDDIIYFEVHIMKTESEEVLITSKSKVRMSEVSAGSKKLATDALQRLFDAIKRESAAAEFIELTNIKLQIQPISVSESDWNTANATCANYDADAQPNNPWRLPTEMEMNRILQHPDAATRLSIKKGKTYWTKTKDVSKQGNFYKTITAETADTEALDFSGGASIETDVMTLKVFNPVSGSDPVGFPHFFIAVRDKK